MNKEMPAHLSLIKEHPDHFLIHDAKDNKAFQVAKKGLHPATQMHVLRMKKYSDGGEIKKMADGTDKEDWQSQHPNWSDDHKNWGDQPGAEDDPQFSQSLKAMPNVPPPMPDGPMSQMTPDQAAVPPAQQVQAPQGTQSGANMNGQQGNQQGMPNGFPSSPQGYPTLGEFNNLEQQGARAINQQTQGQIGQNFEQAKSMRDSQALEQEYMAHSQRVLDNYQQQNDRLMNDVSNGKIDPDKYWENHSRMGAAFAVLLGGIGAGLQHSTQNTAMDVIQNGINRSIDAQKAELGKKENLLSNNLKVQGNLQQAQAATMLQMRAMAQGKLAQIAMETGDPVLQAQAQQRIVQMKMGDIPIKQQLAQYQTQMHMRDMLSKSDTREMDPAKLVPYVVANDRQAKVYDEIKDAQNINSIAKPSLAAFDQAAQEVRPASGGLGTSLTAFVPGMESPGQKAWRGMANTTVKEVEGTARQAAFKSLEDNYKPQAWDNDDTIKSKRDGWVNYLRSHSSAPTAMGEHLDLTKFKSTRFPEEALTPQGAGPKEGQTASNGKDKLIFSGGSWRPLGR